MKLPPKVPPFTADVLTLDPYNDCVCAEYKLAVAGACLDVCCCTNTGAGLTNLIGAPFLIAAVP